MAYDVKSVNTTLCYLRRGEDYLMLHRVKKQNDVNQDKWIGVGGKFEADESPEDCLLRPGINTGASSPLSPSVG